MRLKDTPEIINLAKELELGRVGDAEKAIREFCVQRVEQIIKPFGAVHDLNQLLELVSSSLGLKFEEVHSEYELLEISQRYPAKGELFFKNLHKELDDPTDAVLIRLNNALAWEPKYVAVIDCRGYKAWRAYFSRWHEVSHKLTMPSQMSFQFRRTPTHKKKPEEQIVDRVAGDLAFYSSVFVPELLAQVGDARKLTFEVVERLRATICSGASREATIRGGVSKAPFPQLLVIADYGLKKDEERVLDSSQMGLFPGTKTRFEPKLRAVEVIASKTATEAGLRIHKNMEVPPESVIARVYEEEICGGQVYSALENLNWWKHSRGRLKDMTIWVEVGKFGDRIFALISKSE